MGLFFTLLYIFTSYVTPTVLYGSFAEYRVELITIVLAIVFSLPKLRASMLAQARETWALLALTVAVVFSFWSHGFFGLSVGGIIDFLTQAMVYPLVLVNCRKRWQIQAVVLAVVAACGFTIIRGATDLFSGTLPSPYVYIQSYGGPDAAYRLQGLGPINDPNDFGQLLALAMPAMFLFWRKGKFFLNFVRVILPAAFLFFGLFESHSRGAMLALLVVMIVSLRRKIGLVPSLVMAVLGFVGATAIGWAGGAGREVTVDQGADRMEAWSTGLTLIKQNPLFGVGYKRFTEYYIITAHNTVVVCAAELGLLGFFCWIVFTLCTMRDLVAVTGKAKKKKRYAHDEEPQAADVGAGVRVGAEGRLAYAGDMYRMELGSDPAVSRRDSRMAGESAGPGWGGSQNDVMAPAGVDERWGTPEPFGLPEETSHGLPRAEISRMAMVLTSAISGYLAAGWFLSRAYVMALFLVGALTQSLFRMGLEEGWAPERMPWGKLLRLSLMTSMALIVVVYVGLRVQHMMPH